MTKYGFRGEDGAEDRADYLEHIKACQEYELNSLLMSRNSTTIYNVAISKISAHDISTALGLLREIETTWPDTKSATTALRKRMEIEEKNPREKPNKLGMPGSGEFFLELCKKIPRYANSPDVARRHMHLALNTNDGAYVNRLIEIYESKLPFNGTIVAELYESCFEILADRVGADEALERAIKASGKATGQAKARLGSVLNEKLFTRLGDGNLKAQTATMKTLIDCVPSTDDRSARLVSWFQKHSGTKDLAVVGIAADLLKQPLNDAQVAMVKGTAKKAVLGILEDGTRKKEWLEAVKTLLALSTSVDITNDLISWFAAEVTRGTPAPDDPIFQTGEYLAKTLPTESAAVAKQLTRDRLLAILDGSQKPKGVIELLLKICPKDDFVNEKLVDWYKKLSTNVSVNPATVVLGVWLTDRLPAAAKATVVDSVLATAKAALRPDSSEEDARLIVSRIAPLTASSRSVLDIIANWYQTWAPDDENRGFTVGPDFGEYLVSWMDGDPEAAVRIRTGKWLEDGLAAATGSGKRIKYLRRLNTLFPRETRFADALRTAEKERLVKTLKIVGVSAAAVGVAILLGILLK